MRSTRPRLAVSAAAWRSTHGTNASCAASTPLAVNTGRSPVENIVGGVPTNSDLGQDLPGESHTRIGVVPVNLNVVIAAGPGVQHRLGYRRRTRQCGSEVVHRRRLGADVGCASCTD